MGTECGFNETQRHACIHVKPHSAILPTDHAT